MDAFTQAVGHVATQTVRALSRVCVTPCLEGLTLELQAGGGDTCIASPPTKLAIHGEDISPGRRTDVPALCGGVLKL